MNVPTASVEMHAERREQKGMAVKDFPAWFKAWQSIGDAKAANDIVIPLTPAIRDALALAPKGKPEDLIFPGCAQVGHREPGLPASGHALRRTFKTIVQNESGVPEEVSAYLLGHQPEGMSQKYLLKWAMRNGTAIKEGQQKISRTMVRLLHQKRKRMTA
ncbi:MAG: hypothetical protein WA446_07990 [Steroidobacteraceae bacterium]